MKKLEIEKTKPTIIIKTFKTDIMKVGLVFSISNFFIAKTSLANNWRSFSSSYSALVVLFRTGQCSDLETWLRLYFFFFGIKLFVFQDRKLKLSASVQKWISWNLTKFQLIQLIQTNVIYIFSLCYLIALKFCEVSRTSFLKRCWKFQLLILKNK